MIHHPSLSRARASASGFTLVEMLIVITMVSILAAIAYPSYTSYVVRANRADAQQTLLQGAQAAERYYIANNSYVGFTLASPLNRSPESGTVIYNMTAPTLTATAFVLRATPTSTATNRADGFLEITSQNLKRWDRNNDNDTADTREDDWNR